MAEAPCVIRELLSPPSCGGVDNIYRSIFNWCLCVLTSMISFLESITLMYVLIILQDDMPISGHWINNIISSKI